MKTASKQLTIDNVGKGDIISFTEAVGGRRMICEIAYTFVEETCDGPVERAAVYFSYQKVVTINVDLSECRQLVFI